MFTIDYFWRVANNEYLAVAIECSAFPSTKSSMCRVIISLTYSREITGKVISYIHATGLSGRLFEVQLSVIATKSTRQFFSEVGFIIHV